MIRFAGIVLVIGAICFAIGMTRPVVIDYFSTSNNALKRQLIQENSEQWEFANTMMDLGIIVPAVGVIIFTFGLRQSSKDIKRFLLAVASALSVSLAAMTWMSNYWVFPRFTLLMTLGILLLGVVLLLQFSKWGGALVIFIETVLVILLYYAYQDVPPGAHLLPYLIAGSILIIVGEKRKMPTSAQTVQV